MPFFDYVCPACGERQDDVLVKKHDQDVPCAECGTNMTKQVAVTKNLLLCGAGFYKQHDAPDPSW